MNKDRTREDELLAAFDAAIKEYRRSAPGAGKAVGSSKKFRWSPTTKHMWLLEIDWIGQKRWQACKSGCYRTKSEALKARSEIQKKMTGTLRYGYDPAKADIRNDHAKFVFRVRKYNAAVWQHKGDVL